MPCLRYGWLPHRLPGKYECGSSFSVDLAFNCPKGAFPTIRHNELRDLTGNLLAALCPDVRVEPVLQTLGGDPISNICNYMKMVGSAPEICYVC